MDHTSQPGSPPAPRLLGLRDAARYAGVSYWTLRDLVAAKAVPVIRLPSGRIASGRSRAGNRPVRIIVPAGDARVKPLRRFLIDIRDLDALIEKWKEGAE